MARKPPVARKAASPVCRPSGASRRDLVASHLPHRRQAHLIEQDAEELEGAELGVRVGVLEWANARRAAALAAAARDHSPGVDQKLLVQAVQALAEADA